MSDAATRGRVTELAYTYVRDGILRGTIPVGWASTSSTSRVRRTEPIPASSRSRSAS